MAEFDLPPFELFYRQHRDNVYSLFSRAVGDADDEDVFQEMFLRALRAYPHVRHVRNLHAWVFTIAIRLSIDSYRKHRLAADTSALSAENRLSAYRQLEPYVERLPHTEQTVVVLRYGYSLDDSDIGAMLGSSPDATRREDSAGIQYLRKERSE